MEDGGCRTGDGGWRWCPGGWQGGGGEEEGLAVMAAHRLHDVLSIFFSFHFLIYFIIIIIFVHDYVTRTYLLAFLAPSGKWGRRMDGNKMVFSQKLEPLNEKHCLSGVVFSAHLMMARSVSFGWLAVPLPLPSPSPLPLPLPA